MLFYLIAGPSFDSINRIHMIYPTFDGLRFIIFIWKIKIIANPAALPSTKISFILNDLVGIKNCTHSLEKEIIIVKIRQYNITLVRLGFLFLDSRTRQNSKHKTKKAVICSKYSVGIMENPILAG